MKDSFKVLAGILMFIFLAFGLLATPVSIFYGIYEWVSVGLEFKVALWEAIKLWALLLCSFALAGIFWILHLILE